MRTRDPERLIGWCLAAGSMAMLTFYAAEAQSQIAYGLPVVEATRVTDNGAPPDTLVTVGAQINASNAAGVHQIAFGIATEAWAQPGSVSRLVGIEASTINREPANAQRKIGAWLTFKNRPDYLYWSPPPDPMNENSQALRIEGETGTGWSRGIVFAPTALRASRDRARPAAIDLSELANLEGVDVIKFPDGCALVYAGRGQLVARCE